MQRSPAHVQLARSLSALALVLMTIFVASRSVAAADRPPISFADVEVDVDALSPDQLGAIEDSLAWRAVDIDAPAFAERLQGPVSIELFADLTVEVGGGRFGRGVSDTTWTAGGAHRSATLTIGETEVRGAVVVDGQAISIVPAGGTTHLIIEEGPNPSEMGEPLLPSVDGIGIQGAADVNAGVAVAPLSSDRSTAADESLATIEVLTVYSTDARTALGGDAGAVASIEATLDASNAVLANSGIAVRLESAAIEPVEYTHPGSSATDLRNALTSLTHPADGVIDTVHARRDELDADVVLMVIGPAGSACGLAWLLQEPADALDDEFGFGVIDTNCAGAPQYGYVHELGHLLGAGHGSGDGDGVFPYSNGFRDDATKVRTIMAYRGACGCDRIPYFSAPRTVDGKVIGSAMHDNTRTLNETAKTVAGFRPLPIVPVPPSRVLETRSGPNDTTIDGQFEGGGVRPAGSTLELQIGGRGGVPTDATAALLNVTAVSPDRGGHITVYPCDEGRPTASNLNYVPGEVVPNAVLAKLDPLGRICIYTHATMDLLVDISAYVPPDSTFGTLVPARLLETRAGDTTIDGLAQGGGARPAGSMVTLQVAGRGEVPSDAVAAMLNVTAIDPDRAGHITVFPCSGAQPTASNLNYEPGEVVANAVLAKLDDQGRVCIYTHAVTDLVVDVNGFVVQGSRIGTLAPARLVETRNGPNDTTVDGEQQGWGPLGPDAVGVVRIVGRGDVPAGATLAFLNVTAVNPDRAGHIAVFPCDEVPVASNVNYLPAQVVANLVVAGIDDDGDTCVSTFGRTDLLVDVTAYM